MNLPPLYDTEGNTIEPYIPDPSLRLPITTISRLQSSPVPTTYLIHGMTGEIKSDNSEIFYIRLPLYNNSAWEFNRKDFLSLFPDSFIGSALSLDPTESIIDLTLSGITPELTSYIYDMVITGKIPGPYEVDSIIASYLAMDILLVVSDPHYESYATTHLHINLLDRSMPNYYEILIDSIQYNLSILSSYLFHITEHESHEAEDNAGLIITILYQNYDVFQQLLKRGVDPNASYLPYRDILQLNPYPESVIYNPTTIINLLNTNQNQALLLAILTNQPDIIQALLPLLDSSLLFPPLRVAVWYHLINIVDILLSIPELDPGSNNNQLLLMLITQPGWTGEQYILFSRLLSDSRVTPTDDLLYQAVMSNRIGVVSLLLKDPRINPNTRNIFFFVVHQGNTDMVRLFLENERLQPFTHDNASLKDSLQQGNLKIARLLLNDIRLPVSGFTIAVLYAFQHELNDLLPELYSDPRWNKHIGDELNFLQAVRNNLVGLVQAYLQDVKLSSDVIEIGLNIAVQNGYKEIIRILRDDPRVTPEYRARLQRILSGSFQKIYGILE